jgi:hypothetical protein
MEGVGGRVDPPTSIRADSPPAAWIGDVGTRLFGKLGRAASGQFVRRPAAAPSCYLQRNKKPQRGRLHLGAIGDRSTQAPACSSHSNSDDLPRPPTSPRHSLAAHRGFVAPVDRSPGKSPRRTDPPLSSGPYRFRNPCAGLSIRPHPRRAAGISPTDLRAKKSRRS